MTEWPFCVILGPLMRESCVNPPGADVTQVIFGVPAHKHRLRPPMPWEILTRVQAVSVRSCLEFDIKETTIEDMAAAIRSGGIAHGCRQLAGGPGYTAAGLLPVTNWVKKPGKGQ